MLIDAHCHLTGNYQKDTDTANILSRAMTANVAGMIAVGTDLEDSKELLELAKKYTNIRLSLGIHPHEAKTWMPDTDRGLIELFSSPLALFVGETGLDWHYDLSSREQQENVFRNQIRLAKTINKPLMVHTRSAPTATIKILEEEGASQVGGIIHCFTEGVDFAKRAVGLGFYISFSGILTFPKNNELIKEAAMWVPEDRLLVETDAPFLAPIPHRGKHNEPAYVTYTAKCLADLRGCDFSRIEIATTNNLEALCGWRPEENSELT
ncbi:MAG: TatD family hydrolase [Holophagaceae bacterium]|nr:TatD family hydrolase [Holophagaceae bacterium]